MIGGDGYDSSSFWWRHERFHLSALFAGKEYLPQIKGDIENLESKYTNIPFYKWDTDDPALIKTTSDAFSAVEEMEAGYLKKIDSSRKHLTSYWLRIADKNRIP
jgi:hypothetical protein